MSFYLLFQFLSHGVIFSRSFFRKGHLQTTYIITFIDVLYSTYYLHILLLQHGDIEINPGPPKEKLKSLSCFHWNVQFTSMTFFVYLRCTLILWF